ncbi:BQ2448_3103 [Microbotryum intermedium]|uniref:BQ2448_3103 protein n=1 Tax=Microbotryum intermedium TaxID=269621 RepID=A0A238FEB0_9BASI|nr:BQ2448_3103 [Microbotryum intermedium]
MSLRASSESQKNLLKPATTSGTRAESGATPATSSGPSHPQRQVTPGRTRVPSSDTATLLGLKGSHRPSSGPKPPVPRKSSARRDAQNRLSFKTTVGSLLPNPGSRHESVQLGGPAAHFCTTARNSSFNVGKPAQVVFAVLTGITPSTQPSTTATAKATASETTSLLARTASSFGKVRALSSPWSEKAVETGHRGLLAPSAPLEPVMSKQTVQGNAAVAAVSAKSIAKLKKQLLDPQQARKVVQDLKRMELPPNLAAAGIEGTGGSESDQLPPGAHLPSTKGYALAPLVIPAADGPASTTDGIAAAAAPSDTTNPATSDSLIPSPGSPSAPYFVIPTPGAVASDLTKIAGPGAIEAAKEGAYELLADISGAMVRRSGAQNGMKAPFDGMGVFIYYWGFEITVPPATMATLSKVRNFQNTVFAVLQAFVIAGGAPELTPFIRYISTYMDIEWDGMQRQDKGELLPQRRGVGDKC